MISFDRWVDYSFLTTFIVGHRYVTVWHSGQPPGVVIDAVLNYVQSLDDEAGFEESRKKPFVILNQIGVSAQDLHSSGLVNNELIDIVMEN